MDLLNFLTISSSMLFGGVLGYHMCHRRYEKQDYADFLTARESERKRAMREARAVADGKLVLLSARKAAKCRQF
jgi:hypothetical protein